MSDKNKSKIYSILTSVLVIAIGVMIFIWPGTMIIMFTKAVGAIIAAFGLIQLIRQITSPLKNPLGITAFICILVFGVWVFLFPDAVSRFIPVVLGILLMVHGIQTILTAISGKKSELSDWGGLLVLGILSTAGGVFSVVCSDWIRNGFMVVLGIILIYDGLTSLLVNAKVSRAEKDIIDIESHDIDDNDDFV